MITNEEAIACTETLQILNLIEKEYYDRIPKDLIDLLQANAIKYYQYFDEKGNLKISNLTEQILCYLNLQYWCTEEEKERLIKKYEENDQKLKEKYDIDKILEKRTNEKIDISEDKKDTTDLTVVKENFLTKLFEKIKNLFKRLGEKK